MKPNCYLRAFEPDDYKLLHQWRTNSDITGSVTGNIIFVSSEREKKWVQKKIFDDTKSIYWAVCDIETTDMIGYTSLRKIDLLNRKAVIGGVTIDKKYWRKHYAINATILVLQYAFQELGLNKVSTDYLASHKVTGPVLINQLGFHKEAVLKKEIFKNGKYHDVEVASILKDEFENLYKTFYNQ